MKTNLISKAVMFAVLAMNAGGAYAEGFNLERISKDTLENGYIGEMKAQSIPDLAIPEAMTETRGPSHNYQRTVENPDGSTTIIGPKFSYAGSGSELIHYTRSSAEGVCRLFGYPEYVSSLSTKLEDNPQMPVINEDGRLDSFYRTYYAYSVVICSNRKMATRSTQYEALHVNDDDSVTIVRPRFDYMGTPSLIDCTVSDKSGVCRLFGYPRYVASTMLDFHDGVVINADGKLADVSRSTRTAFDTIVCAK